VLLALRSRGYAYLANSAVPDCLRERVGLGESVPQVQSPGQRIKDAASSWMKAVAGRGVMPISRSGWSSQVPGWVSEYNAIPISEAISGLIRASARCPTDIAASGTCRTLSVLPVADSKAATTCILALGMLLLGNVVGHTGWAPWFPWSIVPILVGSVRNPVNTLPIGSIVILAATFIAGIAATIWRLQTADNTQ